MKDTGTDERITTIDLILVQLDKWVFLCKVNIVIIMIIMLLFLKLLNYLISEIINWIGKCSKWLRW